VLQQLERETKEFLLPAVGEAGFAGDESPERISEGEVLGAQLAKTPWQELMDRFQTELERYFYFAAMAVNGVSALAIYRLSGTFNVFHALALYSLFNITMALRPTLTRPRPYQWLSIHYQWIAWSYAGLCAAAVTEFLLRVIGLSGWVSAALGTPPVILLGGVLIRRFAPRPRTPAAASAR
jgi:hypothetical protein